jgi:CRISPR/Cas system-associated exonuclease Cas4 (RecB family)
MTNHHRSLSYSEISTALTCQAQHSFSYTGHLVPGGSVLRSKRVATPLSAGSAWGAGVAAWHRAGGGLLGLLAGSSAIRESLEADYAKAVKLGVLTEQYLDDRMELEQRLNDSFIHYTANCTPMTGLTRLEDVIDVPVLSRTGNRPSSKYRFGAMIDGFWTDAHGNEWIVEFKYFKTLRSRDILQLSRQLAWYAWARQQQSGSKVVGVIVDERLNMAPNQPRVVKAKRKADGIGGHTLSASLDQATTVEMYLAACEVWGVEPHQELLEVLENRVWQQRVYMPFRPSELRTAGRDLTSAAKLIRDLDSGELSPIRNGQARLCNSCDFKRICPDPTDEAIVDLYYTRSIPKRLKRAEDHQPHQVEVPTTTTEEVAF